MIDRILSVEQAVKEGLSQKEERQSHLSILSLTPIKPRYNQTADSSDDESLLHQLRREDYYRTHKGGDYYHDENGQYNISLDDQSTFNEPSSHSLLSTPVRSRISSSFQMPPPSSRLSFTHIQDSSISETSFLGDLPHICNHGGVSL